MAAAPWNRVNIPFPGAASTTRIQFSKDTEAKIENVLVENAVVLDVLRSEILVTEVRVLYGLRHVLSNSHRAMKTFRALRQVEQCINRVKDMKLSQALDNLTHTCPNRAQRSVGIKEGMCEVPSQPTLEWTCLKVLGGAQLMSCTMGRCSRAFILSWQHLKCEEFMILNIIFVSMFSRLWVLFRGVMRGLAALYQPLLELLGEVSAARPMPYLKDLTLPSDLSDVLGPSHSRMVAKMLTQQQLRQQVKKKMAANIPAPAKNQPAEDLGVTVKRGTDQRADGSEKPWTTILKVLKEDQQVVEKDIFKKNVSAASSFTELVTHLQKMVQWCQSQRLEKEKRRLSFLRLKCGRMRSVEASGHRVQAKLRRCKREACSVFSRHASPGRTRRRPASAGGNVLMRTRVHLLKRRLRFRFERFSAVQSQSGNRERRKGGEGRSTWEQGWADASRIRKTLSQAPPSVSHMDDIDDIFAIAGL